LETVRYLVESGIPVMGHLGLTPQSVHQLGGFRVQGRGDEAAARLRGEALQLQEAGCFSIVLEAMPAPVANDVS
jgi:3-methyl-2-oxobutanoate hydroxymethyltransferase